MTNPVVIAMDTALKVWVVESAKVAVAVTVASSMTALASSFRSDTNLKAVGSPLTSRMKYRLSKLSTVASAGM